MLIYIAMISSLQLVWALCLSGAVEWGLFGMDLVWFRGLRCLLLSTAEEESHFRMYFCLCMSIITSLRTTRSGLNILVHVFVGNVLLIGTFLSSSHASTAFWSWTGESVDVGSIPSEVCDNNKTHNNNTLSVNRLLVLPHLLDPHPSPSCGQTVQSDNK